MNKAKESFVAFFSYARLNDEVDRGRLTSLRKLLQNEIWAQTGKPFQIFQDNEHIEWGNDWMERIKNVLDASSLLIAVVTPSYLVSPSCRLEFEYFLNQESQLKRKLILPILYIDASGLKDTNDEIAVEISRRQWIDWRDLRFTSLTSAKMNKKIELLAIQIRDLISDETSSINRAKKESEFPPDSVLRETTGEDTQQIKSIPTPPTDFLPSLYIPLAQNEKDYPPQLITVVLRSTNDRKRDRRRIKAIYGTLISFHGRDHFSLQIFEAGKGHLIDFPYDTTRVCLELLERLKKLMGEERWRVEEITFQ
jgi:hypothetical protein